MGYLCLSARVSEDKQMIEENVDNLSFTRKHRAKNLIEYIGNRKAVDTVMKAMEKKRPQVILLEGNQGCGKTSLARLITKEYVCENRDPIKGACCECTACKIIEDYIQRGDTSNLYSIKEMNVAEQNRKRDMEAILDEVQYDTFDDSWRIYIFDECHRASKEAQNSILKLIEEPPKNILFIFCTTEKKAVIPTLLSRMQLSLTITKPSLEELSTMIINIANKEGILCDKRAISVIAGRCNFIPRDSINLFERIYNEKGSVTYQNTIEVVQEFGEELLFDFYNKLNKQDTFGYVGYLHEIQKKVPLDQFMDMLLNFTRRGIYVINGVDVEGLTDKEIDSYKRLFGNFSVYEIGCILRTLLDIKSSAQIETKLLMLGYLGFDTRRESGDEKTRILSSLMTSEVQEEINAENRHGSVARLEKRQIDTEASEEYAREMTQPSSIDDILSLFEGSEVKDM